jgi:Zn ribbon nucleic-acid-binding protein
MSGIDADWAIRALEEFVHASDQVGYRNTPDSGVVRLGRHQREPDSNVAELAHVAEQMLDRFLPEWSASDGRPAKVRRKARRDRPYDWAGRGIAALKREQALREKLGDNAPQLSAAKLQLWVRGAMAAAEGIHAGICKLFIHEDPSDVGEQVALEYLAALSVLARWVDEPIVECAS